MKRILTLVLTLAMLACLFAGCNQTPAGTTAGIQTPTTGAKPTPSTPVPSTPAPTDPVDPWAGYECITIAEAIEICNQTGETQTTDKYYIRGTIDEIWNATYGNMNISDKTGTIKIYGSYSADGSTRFDKMETKPEVGAEVLLYGVLVNYKGNTPEMVDAWIIDFKESGNTQQPSQLPAFDSTLTIAEVLALPVTDKPTEGRYYIRATIDSITNAQYGSMMISDGTGSISVFRTENEDGSKLYSDMEEKPYKGDEILIHCTIKKYRDTIEIDNAHLIEFKTSEGPVNEADYIDMTIEEARNTAKGAKIKTSGVIAAITYDGNHAPAGVILVDETGSIYVYDQDLAARAAKGNKVTILATKDYWIREEEIGNAGKFGYIGCNQLTDVIVKDIDNGTYEFDKSWISDSTVKQIIDTPVSTDISTKLYKVTALVKEVPGNGFTNYHFYDLDGNTYAYTYSQCGGSDFAWLKEFDNKICTVYLMALNAKSEPADCFWRFLPVAVIDEGFDPSSVNVAENAVKYYGLTQFLNSYSGNPALEVLTNVNNELLGYTGAALSYTSSNESVIKFELVDGKLVMNCLGKGTATITVTGTYGDTTYSESMDIQVTINEEVTYMDVNTAINTNAGETVVVKGIVGPSLVNQVGFYLIDETGIIAVRADSDVMATLKIGYEVVITGTRYIATKGGEGYFGQSCINNATIVNNYYGENEYCTDFFITGKTLADLYNLNVSEDHTTEVYVVKATVEFIETAYYTTLKLSDNGTTFSLYMASANQYKFLKDYAGQEITMEIAPCNWNDKTYYTGCVLSIILEDGTRVYNELNFAN